MDQHEEKTKILKVNLELRMLVKVGKAVVRGDAPLLTLIENEANQLDKIILQLPNTNIKSEAFNCIL